MSSAYLQEVSDFVTTLGPGDNRSVMFYLKIKSMLADIYHKVIITISDTYCSNGKVVYVMHLDSGL